jgi:hypothetical protein
MIWAYFEVESLDSQSLSTVLFSHHLLSLHCFFLNYSVTVLRFLATQNAACHQHQPDLEEQQDSLDTHAEAYYPVYQYSYS